MTQNLSPLRLFLSVVVLVVLLLGPTAVPIITPRASVRTIIACQSQTTGTIVVTDSRGRIYTQTCGAGTKSMLGYPGLYPTEDEPWLVVISMQPSSIRAGLPRICHSQITSVPIHLECAAISPAPLTVDVVMILTFDFGGYVDLAHPTNPTSE
jgi:hypothetical protein